ncbi:galactose oxidase [Methylopila capsulata]|uniref:Galactose oxidase n=1 Tax=Methylopila capsulata TaxID=61654 RepID=A0A9W6MQV2_9HYPH|nr:RICIN domain-containing protein [Methylopila capsulata]MBM7851346.1 galactose oxidase [Methylopila capsulata]GLK54404.1 galactose oxidase [Methylopila capsulata]
MTRTFVSSCVVAAALAAATSPAYAQAPLNPPGGSALVINRNSGMCVQIAAANAGVGAATAQNTCRDMSLQQWRFNAVGSAYRIVNAASGMCLAARTVDGPAVTQVPCNGETSQSWTLRASGAWAEIVSVASGECLDVTGGSIDGAASVTRASCNGQKNSQKWTLSPKLNVSIWSNRISLPLVPAAASTLRNGKILLWSAYDKFSFGGDRGKTFTTIFDPQTGTSSSMMISNTAHDMFCPGTAVLTDGRILVNGGSSSAKTSIYDPEANTWTTGDAMNVPRGYQGDTVLPNGDVFTVGGSWSGGTGNKTGEVWNAARGWRKLPKVNGDDLAGNDPKGLYRSDNHMWLFAWSNDHVLKAGPSAEMHWIDVRGDGAIASAGARGDDVYAQNGNVVMYASDKLLKLGGAPAYENVQASDAAYVIDFSRGPGAPASVTKQKPMQFPRAFANAVPLPNGQVVVVGGQNVPVPFTDNKSAMIPELWTPEDGSFTRLAVMTVPRNYHSVAVLMLDGRVFVGGGGLCGTNCPANHPDAEILTPPYLLTASGARASRPTIQSAPATASPTGAFTVKTNVPVRTFAIVRLGAVTHSVNNDQRRLAVDSTSTDGLTHQIRLPQTSALVKGDWMLFAMTAAGVPSVAKIVRIQ